MSAPVAVRRPGPCRMAAGGFWSVPVEPPQVDRVAGGEAVHGLGDDRKRVGCAERRENVAPLPSSPAGQTNRNPPLAVANGDALLVALRDDPEVRSPPGCLGHVVAKDAAVARPEKPV